MEVTVTRDFVLLVAALVCLGGCMIAWPDKENPKVKLRRGISVGFLITGVVIGVFATL